VAIVISWATDLLDGPLARRDSSGRRTWLGDNDLGVDVTVALALLGYLASSGYIAPVAALTYLALCLALLWRFRSRALAMACQAPPYGTMLYNALRYVPSYGALAVGWIALTVIGTWPRFPKVIVPEFLRGIRELWEGEDR
jgi:phosphatidylglycerophosphate synthase